MTDTPAAKKPRSLRNVWPAYITFINRTDYPVDIGWLNHEGDVVRYRAALSRGGLKHVNTFVSHPWIAWHASTLEPSWFNGKSVFLPQPWRGEQHRTVVYIDRPLNSLLKLSMQAIRNLVPAEDIDKLEIPKVLHGPLKKRRRIDFVDYDPRSR